MQKLIDLGERAILQTIIPKFVSGAGDDCAAVALPLGELVATTDPVPPPAAAVIGGDTDPFWMGWLLVTINASDLAAAGARPLAFLSAIECEPDREVAAFERMLDGIRAGCDEAGLPYVGGNIREATKVAAVGIGLGICHPHRPIKRTGAKDGDLVLSVGQGGVFWRDALRVLEGIHQLSKEESPLFKPRSQIKIMQRLAEHGLISAAMDNSDGLLPTLSELATKNNFGITIDVDRLTIPGLNGDERDQQGRLWLGWGDWNVITCVARANVPKIFDLADDMGATVVEIGLCSSTHSGVRLARSGNMIEAPRLESERFAPDSWMTKGIGEYVRMLRSVPLP